MPAMDFLQYYVFYNCNTIHFLLATFGTFILQQTHFEVHQQECPFEILFLMVKHIGDNAPILDEILLGQKGRIMLEKEFHIKDLFDEIYNEILMQQPGYISFIDSRLKQLYILLLRQQLQLQNAEKRAIINIRSNERNTHVLNQLKQYITDNLSKKLTLEMLSKHFYFHPKYLSMLLKKETGKSLSIYIQSVRMDRARELLVHTTLPVESIAQQLGFSSVQHFYKTFKKEMGFTPNTLRQQYTNAPRDDF